MSTIQQPTNSAATSRAYEVFDQAPYIAVARANADGTSSLYHPLSVARYDDKTFYFHCASDAEKIANIGTTPISVDLNAVIKYMPSCDQEKWAFPYFFYTAHARGEAALVTDRAEKVAALRRICERFIPGEMHHFDKVIARTLERTAVIKITLTEAPVFGSKSRECTNLHAMVDAG